MTQVQIDSQHLRDLVREAVAEALEQRKDQVYDAVTEAIEDIALSNAIREGDRGEFVSRDEVFSILENNE
jgi:hypothetical protein